MTRDNSLLASYNRTIQQLQNYLDSVDPIVVVGLARADLNRTLKTRLTNLSPLTPSEKAEIRPKAEYTFSVSEIEVGDVLVSVGSAGLVAAYYNSSNSYIIVENFGKTITIPPFSIAPISQAIRGTYATVTAIMTLPPTVFLDSFDYPSDADYLAYVDTTEQGSDDREFVAFVINSFTDANGIFTGLGSVRYTINTVLTDYPTLPYLLETNFISTKGRQFKLAQPQLL